MKNPNRQPCLHDFVFEVAGQFLEDMGNTPPDNLHSIIMDEAERALVRAVLSHTNGNQSQAAGILGITRTTLRNRIRRYQLD